MAAVGSLPWSAVLMSAGGLSFSLMHLGHPERAWMALSQWRSSWLSREGVAAVLCLLSYAAWCGLKLFFGMDIPALGILSAVLAGYSVHNQHDLCPAENGSALEPFRDACDVFGLCRGWRCYAVRGDSERVANMVGLVGSVGGGWCANRMAGFSSSPAVELGWHPETATGLGHLGRVRLFEKPTAAKTIC